MGLLYYYSKATYSINIKHCSMKAKGFEHASSGKLW